jgi:hypothetical protein
MVTMQPQVASSHNKEMVQRISMELVATDKFSKPPFLTCMQFKHWEIPLVQGLHVASISSLGELRLEPSVRRGLAKLWTEESKLTVTRQGCMDGHG